MFTPLSTSLLMFGFYTLCGIRHNVLPRKIPRCHLLTLLFQTYRKKNETRKQLAILKIACAGSRIKATGRVTKKNDRAT